MTLEDIKKYNNDTFQKDSAHAYHHVVYLIDSETHDDQQESDVNLWNSDSDFLSVIRVHFPDTTNLQEQFRRLNVYLSTLASTDDYNGIAWRAYYTMELSDMVIISKAKSFLMLSRWSLLATKCKYIGNAYTYFCIPGALLSPNRTSWTEEYENDYIDFLAMRFSVRDVGAYNELFSIQSDLGEEYTDSPCRVVGNEDAIICGREVPMLNLIKLYQKWYKDDNIFNAFSNIITRVGAKILQEPGSFTEEGRKKSALEKYSYAVQEKVRNNVLNNREAFLQGNREWLRPLVELTNALVHMSRTATLDEPVLLILPGVNAFWDNIISGSELLSDKQLYLRFAELCVHTMEHLMREEGQLSQRPEVRPLAYDIPVFVLEYATTFLFSLYKVLTKPDINRKETISFLLVPSAEVDVSTVELFQAQNGVPGLLQTTVPFSLLYSPQLFLPALCHELAHYVGETLRMREQRYQYFLMCAANELINIFFDKLVGDREKLVEYIGNFFLGDTLEAYYQVYEQIDQRKVFQRPLLEIVDTICNITWELTKMDAYAELVRNYVLSEYQGAQFYSVAENSLEERVNRFAHRISDLARSFRETYADICMLYLLELPPELYLEVSLRQWEDINTSTFLRAYVSLSTAGYSLSKIQRTMDEWGQAKEVNFDKRNWAYRELDGIAQIVEGNTSERFLAKYIQGCWEEIKTDCPQNSPVDQECPYTPKEIYRKILKLDTTTSYSDIIDIIDIGRQIMIKQFEHA
ncbi:MAG: hypothetical protein ACI3V4_12825 [Faecousia sp.]